MRAPYTELYLHAIWATWDRLPLVSPTIRPRVYAAVAAKCRDLKCEPMAIGGTADHVHLLVRLHTTVSVATLVKGAKGASSHLVTHELTPDDFFKWQGAYRAFTLRKAQVQSVRAYISAQEQHHTQDTVIHDWEWD